MFLPTSTYSNGLTSIRLGVIWGIGNCPSWALACFSSLAGSPATRGINKIPRQRAAGRNRFMRSYPKRMKDGLVQDTCRKHFSMYKSTEKNNISLSNEKLRRQKRQRYSRNELRH